MSEGSSLINLRRKRTYTCKFKLRKSYSCVGSAKLQKKSVKANISDERRFYWVESGEQGV